VGSFVHTGEQKLVEQKKHFLSASVLALGQDSMGCCPDCLDSVCQLYPLCTRTTKGTFSTPFLVQSIQCDPPRRFCGPNLL
jgi:hypothetical protein